MPTTHKGACFCGTVTVETSGEPMLMGYCHCSDCRSWSAGPVNAFTLWSPENVKVTAGVDRLATYAKTDNSHRKYCSACGGHVMTDHPGAGFVDVYAATLPDLEYRPAIHVFYSETVLPMKDGLPKFKDTPAEAGGSGEMIAE